ncbi:MAG: DHA2 family efflux MFS transporter permease subunit [Pseudomonadota bacterium]
MTTATADASSPTPSLFLTTVSVCLAAGMQSMDTFIAAIALPSMMGAFSAGHDEIAWVLTAFLIAVGVFTPLTGWLSRRIGRKRLLLIAIVGFCCASVMSGLSNTIPQIVPARFLQGMFGAALVPLSQQILLDIYPRERHGMAMAWFNVGMLVGLIVGPLLGGYITEYYSWRYVFFINLPTAIVAFTMISIYVRETEPAPRPFDFIGFFALATALISLQLMLDRGERLDWFSSTEIIIEAGIATAAFYVFVIHITTARNPFVDPALFRNRNFAIGMVYIFVLAVLIFGFLGIFPAMLQNHLGYSVLASGVLLSPRGLATFVASIVSGMLFARIGPRPIIFVALVIMAISLWHMSTYTRDVDYETVLFTLCLQGLGFGMLSTTVTAAAYMTLTPDLRPDGTAFLSLARRIGASLGVSFMVSQLLRYTQANRAALNENVSLYNETLQHRPLPEGWSLVDPQGLSAFQQELVRQAEFMAYLDDFRLLALIVVLITPFVFFLKMGRPGS